MKKDLRNKNHEEIAVFCQNIKELREKDNLSKKEMAKIIGIGVAGLTKLEQGIIPPRAGMDMILNFSRYFKIKPSKLFMCLQAKSR